MIREPVVSGKFYPSNPEKIKQSIDDFHIEVSSKTSARGIILPHAGYMYSGKVAATTVAKVSPRKTLLILGPNHTGYGKDFALYAQGAWKVPGGALGIDEMLAQKILSGGSTIQEDTVAHQYEHSIEVELPILRHYFGDFLFVPVACHAASSEAYRAAANQLTKALKSYKEDVLLVASTDMTHYEPEVSARKKDRDALDCITALDPDALIARVRKENITMCGLAPVSVLLMVLKDLGAHKAQVVLYQTSGDSSGDFDAVVGYAGVIIQ